MRGALLPPLPPLPAPHGGAYSPFPLIHRQPSICQRRDVTRDESIRIGVRKGRRRRLREGRLCVLPSSVTIGASTWCASLGATGRGGGGGGGGGRGGRRKPAQADRLLFVRVGSRRDGRHGLLDPRDQMRRPHLVRMENVRERRCWRHQRAQRCRWVWLRCCRRQAEGSTSVPTGSEPGPAFGTTYTGSCVGDDERSVALIDCNSARKDAS